MQALSVCLANAGIAAEIGAEFLVHDLSDFDK
jgi:hypothetical protein